VGAAVLMLAGCETDAGWRPHRDSAVTERPIAAPVQQATKSSGPGDAYCRSVAGQRAEDAKVNRLGTDIQNIIYRGTYKDCVAWSADHEH
jgi:hypothetical protein